MRLRVSTARTCLVMFKIPVNQTSHVQQTEEFTPCGADGTHDIWIFLESHGKAQIESGTTF